MAERLGLNIQPEAISRTCTDTLQLVEWAPDDRTIFAADTRSGRLRPGSLIFRPRYGLEGSAGSSDLRLRQWRSDKCRAVGSREWPGRRPMGRVRLLFWGNEQGVTCTVPGWRSCPSARDADARSGFPAFSRVVLVGVAVSVLIGLVVLAGRVRGDPPRWRLLVLVGAGASWSELGAAGHRAAGTSQPPHAEPGRSAVELGGPRPARLLMWSNVHPPGVPRARRCPRRGLPSGELRPAPAPAGCRRCGPARPSCSRRHPLRQCRCRGSPWQP